MQNIGTGVSVQAFSPAHAGGVPFPANAKLILFIKFEKTEKIFEDDSRASRWLRRNNH